jgi:N-acetylmuramate 1-kinase
VASPGFSSLGLAAFIDQFLVEQGARGDPPHVKALLGDGSERRFYRVRQASRSFILLHSPRKKLTGTDENDSYFLIGNHLFQRNIPVPRILSADLQHGFFLLEDLGDYHFQVHANRFRGHLATIYSRAVQLLASLHELAREGFSPSFCFDTAYYNAEFVYQRELEYFREFFLNGCLRLAIGPEDMRRDFQNIAERAGFSESRWVMHRDFQSRNIMVTHQQLRLIDFQGMRHGPPAYDLASLLLDPYVRIPHETEQLLIGIYWSRMKRLLAGTHQDFLESYNILRLCRNLQVLGAYSYLGLVKGKNHFLGYLAPALKQLYCWLNWNYRHDFPTLWRVVKRLPAYFTSFS